MRPPIRRFAPIGAMTLVIALVAATAFLAVAQDRSEARAEHLLNVRRQRQWGRSVSGRERRGDEKNDERYDYHADRRRRFGFRCNDGAAPSRGDRHGRCSPSPRSQPADQAAGPGNHRHPAAGDHRYAARGRPIIAGILAGTHATFVGRVPRERSPLNGWQMGTVEVAGE